MTRPQRRARLSRSAAVAWLVLAISCAAYLLFSLAHHQAFHPWGRLGYFDLRVYRGAAQLIIHGRPLYEGPIWHWAPFTYPPFAAIVFTPLALLPLAIDELVVTTLGVVALFLVVARALRLPSEPGRATPQARVSRSVITPLAAAAALWLEPITSTLGYGQINLLIAALIVFDLSRPDTAVSKGAMIGLAAGLKLTPLIFVPYLLFSRRRRAAAVALAAFAATAATGYALLPGDSQGFWGGLFLDSQRVGGCCVPANQSLRGAILRLVPSAGSGLLLGIAIVTGIVGVTLAVLASRRGDEAMGFSRCAITGLLVSPVSWTHHWTLAVPALVLLGARVIHRRSKTGMVAFAAIVLVAYSYLPKLMQKPGFLSPSHPRLGWALASAPYVLIGVVALVVACLQETARWADAAGRTPHPERSFRIASTWARAYAGGRLGPVRRSFRTAGS